MKKYMEIKKIILSGMMVAASFSCLAQSLEKMQWFNEPEQWKIAFDECHPSNRLLAYLPLWVYRG